MIETLILSVLSGLAGGILVAVISLLRQKHYFTINTGTYGYIYRNKNGKFSVSIKSKNNSVYFFGDKNGVNSISYAKK